MEKLLIAAMQNPTPANKANALRHADKHPMSVCFLPENLMTVLNQYRREA